MTNRRHSILLASVFTLARAAASMACATSASLEQDIARLAGEQPPTQLVDKRTISLPSLGIDVCLVEIAVQIPKIQAMFLYSGDTWELLSVEKRLVDGWEDLLARALEDRSDVSDSEANAAEISRDLCRILVDPDPRYGVVIDSANAIPTDYESSDIRRDLLRATNSEAEVRAQLLSRAPRLIRPPVLEKENGCDIARFFTWGYFGGEIAEWVVPLCRENSIVRNVLSERIGSYDIYH